jgi:predicted dehydrogenase
MKRRRFVKTVSGAAAGLVAARAPLFATRWPAEKVVVCVMGLNGRGTVLAKTFAKTANAEVASVCDVDSTVLAKAAAAVGEAQGKPVNSIVDFRRALDDKSVDALVIATPDHWHAPATMLALAAGKHVYVEKPSSHNARECELLVDAQRKAKRLVQMGTQRRSSPRAIEAIEAIRSGIIGRPYFAHAWYANSRKTIGRGKAAAVPSDLDYELWQGPAPRAPFKDNVVHYNWHWFRRWGTGEICNNGTHELDVARWALGVDRPVRVTSAGGRYHFDDDWEFTDTQETAFEFDGGRAIAWQGRSCNPYPIEGRGRGTMVHGTTGTMVVDQDGYTVYDLEKKVVKQNVAPPQSANDGLAVSGDDQLTALHIANFVEGVRTGAPLTQPIDQGVKSVLLCHLGNIAQWTGRALRVDPQNGHILGDNDAMKFWQRDYAPGWAPTV